MDFLMYNEFVMVLWQEVLLEFRAGKMHMEGKRVVADPRKGLVRIGRGEEGLVHIQWLDRSNNIIEDDQIVFPEEAVFEKVGQASGRVYILKFQTDDRKCFFWMQEPNAENDVAMCNSVNLYLNQPIEFPMEDDTLGEDNSSGAGNVVGSSMGPEVTSDVFILRDWEAVDLDGGLGLGDILKPELVFPLMEKLSLEEVASHLPEGTGHGRTNGVAPKPSFSPTSRFFYLYKFTVLSFLEALEDSVGEKSNTESDLRSETCTQSDKMDEGQ
ncbi:hypothetical protein OSB04_014710 [Centaurea solstitialis]|uniref:Pru domain-containing protein n=1 Tax=Centaurea solstitialis TaxID=347529 RepID=A0AA38SXL0_9ASTR|nr:hypothetical protein OSB04_014710 [Centaurea solstitialis]